MIFERIRNLREDRDINQSTISTLLNIDQSTYSDYERGEILVPITALITLAEFYETSIDFLIGKTDVKKPYPKSS